MLRFARFVCLLSLPIAGFAQNHVQPGTLAPDHVQPGTLPPDHVQPGAVAPAEDLPEATIRTSVNVVVAPTTVLDKHGNYVNGLSVSDFTLYDNGKAQRVNADLAMQPISLVLAVQCSYMLDQILPMIQRIGNQIADQVAGADSEMAVMKFDSRITTLQDFTSDGAKVAEALRTIKPGTSQGRLVDATIAAVRMLNHRPQDRRRILVLVSEKRDLGSEAHLREALTAAQFANVTIYSLNISHLEAMLTGKSMPPRPNPIPATAQHVPGGAPLTPNTIMQNEGNGNFIPLFVEIFKGAKSLFVDDQLDVLTRFTGGKEYSFTRSKNLEKSVEALGIEIHSQYLLSYRPNNLDEGGFHQIRVEVNRPELDIRTRPGYWTAARVE